MTIDEFLAQPDTAGRVRSLIAGRVYERPERSRNRRDQRAIDRLLDLLGREEGPTLRTDYLFRHEPQDLFQVELAAITEGERSIPLVVIIPRPAETYGETSGKVEACLAGGVGQVWLLESYADDVKVWTQGDRQAYFRGDAPLPEVPGLPVVTPTQIYQGLPQPESALPDGIAELWVDQLREKHECFGIKHTETADVTVDGRRVELVLPDFLAETEVLFATERDGLLFAIGRGDEYFDDRPAGVLMVARRHGSGVYLVHVWHELYPYAFKYLGLDPQRQ